MCASWIRLIYCMMSYRKVRCEGFESRQLEKWSTIKEKVLKLTHQSTTHLRTASIKTAFACVMLKECAIVAPYLGYASPLPHPSYTSLTEHSCCLRIETLEHALFGSCLVCNGFILPKVCSDFAEHFGQVCPNLFFQSNAFFYLNSRYVGSMLCCIDATSKGVCAETSDCYKYITANWQIGVPPDTIEKKNLIAHLTQYFRKKFTPSSAPSSTSWEDIVRVCGGERIASDRTAFNKILGLFSSSDAVKFEHPLVAILIEWPRMYTTYIDQVKRGELDGTQRPAYIGSHVSLLEHRCCPLKKEMHNNS